MLIFNLLKAALAALASAAAFTSGPAETPRAPATPAVRTLACKHVKIAGRQACLGPNRFCTRQWQSTYRDYGYTCSYLDHNDRYRLRRLARG